MKTASSWYSPRIGQEIRLVRWGHWGTPVLLFPTAGGDAEEAERMGLLGAIWPLIEGGRVKVYSLDSIAGRTFADRAGSPEHRFWMLNGFEEMVAHEIVPAIRSDCDSAQIEVIAAGASIGAFKATAVLCRYPHLFRSAVGMSGSYDLERLFGLSGNEHYYHCAPLAFLGGLHGPLLERLQQRFLILAYGEGRWENPDDSWRMANLLGAKGVPNRVDPWGETYDHDWPTWRQMLPTYLEELTS
ncbi:MAG: alpha/beta hydrolase-fold protein [Pseudomonadota bacterium]